MNGCLRIWLLATLALIASCRPTAGRGDGPPRTTTGAPPSGSTAPSTPARPAPSTARAQELPAEPPPTRRVSLQGTQRAAVGTRGMVASVEEHATRAGVLMLDAGGTAADAAVAVAYALAVTHPSAGNIGGGGLALVRPSEGPTVAFDFRERAPLALTQEHFDAMIAAHAVGPAAAGVPGSVSGLDAIHRRFGRLSRAQVLAPAIALARDGHRLGARQAKTIRWAWPELSKNPAARAIYGAGSGPLPRGALLRQPDLADTLERIAQRGPAGFYDGPTAEQLVASMGTEGVITRDDLKRYRTVVRDPITLLYRGIGVHVAPPPSAGGVAVAQMLLAHQHFQTWEMKRADALHFFVEIARRAHATRRFHVVDPDSVPNYDAHERRSRWLDLDAFLQASPPIDPAKSTPSSKVDPHFDAAMRELEHTTHLSVVDSEGLCVSLTTTLSAGFGARFVVPETGIVLNNAVAAFGTVGEDVPSPGRRMTTSMSPTILVDMGGSIAVLGSPGGDTIPNTVVQLIQRLVDDGLPLERAVEAPRIHHGFVPDEVRYEQARPIPKSDLANLRARGHTISKKRIPIGDANVIVIRNGRAWGYADSREGGLALGPEPAVDGGATPPAAPSLSHRRQPGTPGQ